MLSNDTILAAVFTDDDGHIFACYDTEYVECQTSFLRMIGATVELLPGFPDLISASLLVMIHLMMQCSEMKSVSKRLSVTRRIPKAKGESHVTGENRQISGF